MATNTFGYSQSGAEDQVATDKTAKELLEMLIESTENIIKEKLMGQGLTGTDAELYIENYERTVRPIADNAIAGIDEVLKQDTQYKDRIEEHNAAIKKFTDV